MPLYDQSLADAWIIRAVLDRIIGWSYSSILYKKSNWMDNVSAWRCQSPLLRFLTEREREIRAFVPRDYYTIHADHKSFVSNHIKNKTLDDNEDLVFNEADGNNMLEKLKEEKEGTIIDYIESTYLTNPKEPFEMAGFNSACSSILWLSLAETTKIGQSLYEWWYLTYIRTDAIVLEDDKNNEIRDYINNNLGGKYLPAFPNVYKNPPEAQAWHMWICPVDINFTPQDAYAELPDKEAKVYELVWKRAIASQMPAAEYEKQLIKVSIKDEIFIYQAVKRSFDWFLSVWNYTVKDSDDDVDESSWINDVGIWNKIPVKAIKLVPHKTKPKSRYKEDTCILKLKSLRIWRPATHASFIETLLDRWYITIKSKKIYVTEKWEAVNDIIMSFAENDIMDFNFTKRMEDLRDDLTNWKIKYIDLAKEFFENIKKTLDANGVYIDSDWFVRTSWSWNANNPWEDTGHACPKCGWHLMRKTTAKWEMIVCSNSTYKDWKAGGCTYFNFLGTYEKTNEICSTCKWNLIITTLKNWGKMKKCEFSVYDSATKKSIGCLSRAEFLK